MSTHSEASALPEAGADQQPSRWNMWGIVKALAFRMAITYFILSLFRRPPANPGYSDQAGGGLKRMPATNMFPAGTRMELYAYLAETPTFSAFNDSSALFWHMPSLVYGDWKGGQHGDGSYSKHGYIDCERQFPSLMKNGSLYLHVYFVKAGFSPDPNAGVRYSQRTTVYKSKMLTRQKRRRLSRTVNLLTGQTDSHPDLVAVATTPDNVTYLPPTTHWHPNLTIHLVDDHTAWTPGAVPAPLDQFIDFNYATNEYYPPVYLNDYWNMHRDYQPLNETTPVIEFWLEMAPISLFKWQLYATQASKRSMFGNWFTDFNFVSDGDDTDEDEQDTIKKTLVETNPWLLAVTVVVSLVHSVFEMLAFKNDIQFWRSRESLEGLSVRSVFFNVFQSLIVCLYVLDNQTNFVIIVSVFVGLGIEVWKIKKVLNINVDYQTPGFLGLLPRIQVEYQSSYVESDTKKYDQMAFRYLSWLLFPMLAGYSVYSLVYQEHRGWYSWVLSMLYGFLLTFGFITMTPQLFINYKLKSVAHLPWRMLTYKALNTFIDDLFAFVIHMPMLYRIGCLRDDVIFFIYLYQRWIYPMDPNRVNEFGVSKEMLDSTTTTTKKKKALEVDEEEESSVALPSSSASQEVENEASNVRRRHGPATDSDHPEAETAGCQVATSDSGCHQL